jgi:hypothetical protein
MDRKIGNWQAQRSGITMSTTNDTIRIGDGIVFEYDDPYIGHGFTYGFINDIDFNRVYVTWLGARGVEAVHYEYYSMTLMCKYVNKGIIKVIRDE